MFSPDVERHIGQAEKAIIFGTAIGLGTALAVAERRHIKAAGKVILTTASRLSASGNDTLDPRNPTEEVPCETGMYNAEGKPLT